VFLERMRYLEDRKYAKVICACRIMSATLIFRLRKHHAKDHGKCCSRPQHNPLFHSRHNYHPQTPPQASSPLIFLLVLVPVVVLMLLLNFKSTIHHLFSRRTATAALSDGSRLQHRPCPPRTAQPPVKRILSKDQRIRKCA
jgi:hypothetical protein